MNWIRTYEGIFINLELIGKLTVIEQEGYFTISAWFPHCERHVDVWKYGSHEEASKDLTAFFTDVTTCKFVQKSLQCSSIPGISDVSGRCR